MTTFFRKKIEYLTVSRILTLTGSSLQKNDSETLEMKIFDVKSLAVAENSHITFFANTKYTNFLENTKAGFCLIKKDQTSLLNPDCVAIINDDPYYAFAILMNEFYGSSEIEGYENGMEEFFATSAQISESAKIGKNVRIFENVVISNNAEIGDNTTILPNAFIGNGVKIGKNVIIHDNASIMFAEIGDNSIIRSGARIGNSGFGFAPNLKNGKHLYIPQISSVIIGKNVDIGANSCIDRGCLENTIIEDNVKIDNLVQIGHGTHVKSSCFIAGATAIAGSVEIGKFVFMGGQVGIVPHVKIADFVQIVPQSGITSDVKIPGSIIAGTPAVPKMVWHKMQIKMQQLLSKKN